MHQYQWKNTNPCVSVRFQVGALPIILFDGQKGSCYTGRVMGGHRPRVVVHRPGGGDHILNIGQWPATVWWAEAPNTRSDSGFEVVTSLTGGEVLCPNNLHP